MKCGSTYDNPEGNKKITFETGNGSILNKKLKLVVTHLYKIKCKNWILRGNPG